MALYWGNSPWPDPVLILEITTWADLAVSSFDNRDHVLECEGCTGSTGVQFNCIEPKYLRYQAWPDPFTAD